MAEIHGNDYLIDNGGEPRSIKGLANTISAALSAALIIGAGMWGYKLLVQAVNGVPVVQASEGPMRVQPISPGGSEASHQGLSVNAVAAEGSSKPASDRIMLAPIDGELAPDDLPNRDLSGAPASKEALTQDLIIDRLISKIVNGETTGPTVEGGLGHSVRPRARPGTLNTTPIPASERVETNYTRLDAATLRSGTRLAQLGAFESPEMAEMAWSRLVDEFGDYLQGRNYVIQEAQSGGNTIYRLRTVGFDDLNEARRFCSALAAEKAECIPVVLR